MRASGAVRDYDIAIQLAESSGSESALAAASIWQRKRAGRWKRVLPQVREASVWKGDTPATTLSAGEETGQSVIWDGALPAARNASLALPLLLDRYVLHGDALHKSALDETGRPSGDLDDSAYHQFRLRTKRIRYALESFEAFYPREPYRELLGSLKNFQQILGNLHDCEVASGMLESTARKGGQEPGEGTGEAEAALVAGGPEADSFAAFLIERRGGSCAHQISAPGLGTLRKLRCAAGGQDLSARGSR
ncbi:MAG: CHAD domain-containing protein [Bryobacterales bacterium]|nr:CHAD domain-containing protein [Bryobacterales bacterium]